MDMTQHLNDMNLQLQGRNQLANDILDHDKTFEEKLRLWEIQLTRKTAHFQSLDDRAKSATFSVVKYGTAFGVLRE
jgi:hypothetical protein